MKGLDSVLNDDIDEFLALGVLLGREIVFFRDGGSRIFRIVENGRIIDYCWLLARTIVVLVVRDVLNDIIVDRRVRFGGKGGHGVSYPARCSEQ